MPMMGFFARAWSWSATISAAANTNISPIRCLSPLRCCASRFIAHLRRLRTVGTSNWVSSRVFPGAQQQFLELCTEHDQRRPTALLLHYREGDYNRLHQDLYGEVAFPFQLTFFLSAKTEYEGGEFVLTEQRPRAQTRPIVIAPDQGDFLVIPNRYRPVAGKNGSYRTTFRHGVSTVRSGERYTLGIIFHDAQ